MARHSHETFFQRLRAFDEFFEPLHREIVNWLEVAPGARAADIGCGAGGVARLLAEAVGEEGAVTAVETSQERLKALVAMVEATPYADRFMLRQGSLPTLPFENDEFDIVWCSRVVHHVPDQVEGVRELKRITKPGGRVLVREGGIPPHFLPHELAIGEDGLEDRVRAAQSVWFNKMRAETENVVRAERGWLGILREAGLERVHVHSFLYELMPPYSPDQILYLQNWLYDIATNDDYALSDADRDALRQLSDPASEHYVLRRDDLHFLYAASVYVGTKS